MYTFTITLVDLSPPLFASIEEIEDEDATTEDSGADDQQDTIQQPTLLEEPLFVTQFPASEEVS